MLIERSDALALARSATFRHFDKSDFYAFSGVCSALPMIAEADGLTLILDGYTLEVVNDEGDYETFDLNEG